MSGKKITGFKPGSKSWKKFMAKVYGWGGAVVIVGAMFKIQHWPGATIMLIGGLGIEAIIFILSAFEPLHEEPDWTLVYPELAALDDEDEDHDHDEADDHQALAVSKAESGTLTEQLDNMLEEAKIEPELIASLGDGLRSLSSQANQLGDITDASVATGAYVDSVKGAKENVDKLSESYVQASQSLTNIAVPDDAGNSYADELQKLGDHLAKLNNVYAQQLSGTSEHVENSKGFYQGIDELMANLNDSIESTKAYKSNISELSNNLSSLNTIYGNMLNAMNPGQQNQ